LLARDAGGRTAQEVAAMVENAGASWHEQTGNNSLALAFESLPNDLALGARVLGDALLRPGFAANTFATERDSQLSELREEADEIDEYGLCVLRRKFFQAHPLQHSAMGTEETVSALKLADVKKHFHQLVTARNLVVAIAGRFERKQVLDLFGPVLEKIPAGSFAPRLPEYAGPGAPGEFVEKLEREQTVVFDAYPDAGVTADDYLVGEVVDELLSGMSSRLFVRVREELALAYYVGAARVTGVRAGMMYFYAGTHLAAHASVLTEFDAEAARLRSCQIEEAELARVRTRLKVNLRLGRQAPGHRAQLAALNALYGLPLNDAAEREARYSSITAVDVAAFAQKYLRPEARVRLVVRPKNG
jgi:zinc protease